MKKYSSKNIEIIKEVDVTFRFGESVSDYLIDFEKYLEENGKSFIVNSFTFEDFAAYYRKADFYTFYQAVLYARLMLENDLIEDMPEKAVDFIEKVYDMKNLHDKYITTDDLEKGYRRFIEMPQYWKEVYGINYRDLATLVLQWAGYNSPEIQTLKTAEISFKGNEVELPTGEVIKEPQAVRIIRGALAEQEFYTPARGGKYAIRELATPEESPYFLRAAIIRTRQNRSDSMKNINKNITNKESKLAILFQKPLTLPLLQESRLFKEAGTNFSDENIITIRKGGLSKLMNDEREKVAHKYLYES